MRGCQVFQTAEKIDLISPEFDLVVSFGYTFILNKALLSQCSIPIINLHLSFLPWNRGSHPNFWSFWDNTPSGVTIHEIDNGIDTGPILFQKNIIFDDAEETFQSSYDKLFEEIEKLFIDNLDQILNLTFSPKKQRGLGTFHYKKEFPTTFTGWQSNVRNEIKRLDEMGFNPSDRILKIIDEIENVRVVNNVNWMELLRVVAVHAPEKLSEITANINKSDHEISELFKKLSNG